MRHVISRYSLLMVAIVGAFFSIEAATVPSDSAVLASAKKYGTMAGKWFIANNLTITTSNTYYNAASWYGILLFDQAIKDTVFRDTVVARYKRLLASNPRPGAVGMVDDNAHGILPLELFRETGYQPFLVEGKRLADTEFVAAHLRSDTLSTYSRFWVDDMYMIGSLQVNAYRNTDSIRYLYNTTRTFSKYIDSLQTPTGTSLYWHSMGSPISKVFWGRGNGWAAAGLSELLQVLPSSHPLYQKFMNAYINQMRAFLKFQDGTGMWHQVIRDTVAANSKQESSCTGMFTFALATGLRMGWIQGDSFKVAAKKGWMAVATMWDSSNGLKNICPGFGANADSMQYRTIAFATGDPHGTAGFVWGAGAIVRLLSMPTPVAVSSPVKHSALSAQANRVDNRLYDLKGRCIGEIQTGQSGHLRGTAYYLYKGRLALNLKK